MLSGNKLISTIKSLPDADIKQVIKTCGYTSIQKNGTENRILLIFMLQLIYLCRTKKCNPIEVTQVL